MAREREQEEIVRMHQVGGGCTSCIHLTHSLKPFYLSSETVLPIK
jgi:hypothetical protein